MAYIHSLLVTFGALKHINHAEGFIYFLKSVQTNVTVAPDFMPYAPAA